MLKENDPLRNKNFKLGIAAMTLTIIPALGLSAFALVPTQALGENDLCVTATRVDNPKIFATNCDSNEEIVIPEPSASASSEPTASPSETSAPIVTPTPTPTPTPPPVVLGPGVANGEVFVQPVSAVSDLRKMVPLNDGGMLIAQSDGVYLTEKRRIESRKLVGIDARLATPLGVEASGNGQTIAVFTDRYIQVSWDGGTTWLTPQENQYYNISYKIRNVAVAENGTSVITVGDAGDITTTGRSMGITKTSGIWKYNGLMFGYKPSMGNDGVSALQPVFHQRLTKNIMPETMANPTVNQFLASNFSAWAASGNFTTQIATMDSTDSKLSLADRAVALRISRDSGATWKIVSMGTFTNLQVSADGQKMVSVDSSNTMRLSTDSGVTWNIIDPIGNGVKANVVRMSADGKSMLIMGSDSNTYQTSIAQVTTP